jgi:hypothetical protein
MPLGNNTDKCDDIIIGTEFDLIGLLSDIIKKNRLLF